MGLEEDDGWEIDEYPGVKSLETLNKNRFNNSISILSDSGKIQNSVAEFTLPEFRDQYTFEVQQPPFIFLRDNIGDMISVMSKAKPNKEEVFGILSNQGFPKQ